MSNQHEGEATDTTNNDKPITAVEAAWAAARWLAKRELLMRIAIVFVLVGLGGCAAWAAASELEKHDAKIVVPLEQTDQKIDARVTKLEGAEAARLEREAARDRVVDEIRLNMRLLLETQKIKPIDVPRFAADAGR